MADNIADIRKMFADNGVMLGRDDVWSVQSATVVKHKALERLAAALKIRWQEPKFLRAERDEAVVLVTGALGDHMEWSIGEALVQTKSGGKLSDQSSSVGNYRVSGNQAAYPYAIAEKRGKDRVIIKLAGIDGYSDEESDDFRRGNGGPALEADATDLLKSAEKSLESAALLGTASLRESWKSLPAHMREAFGGSAPVRLKELAAKHDDRVAA